MRLLRAIENNGLRIARSDIRSIVAGDSLTIAEAVTVATQMRRESSFLTGGKMV